MITEAADTPDWFPYVAELFVPSLLGLATLSVSIVSLVIARRMHDLGAATARQEQIDADRRDRAVLAEDITGWAHGYFSTDTKPQVAVGPTARLSALGHHYRRVRQQ